MSKEVCFEMLYFCQILFLYDELVDYSVLKLCLVWYVLKWLIKVFRCELLERVWFIRCNVIGIWQRKVYSVDIE